jgi:hypothetical protein
LALKYGRYGYLRITGLLQKEGWQVNHKRGGRIWRGEVLKVPARQPKRGRLWTNDGSCYRLRPTHRNHVWSYALVMDATDDAWPYRVLNVVDEFPRMPYNQGSQEVEPEGCARSFDRIILQSRSSRIYTCTCMQVQMFVPITGRSSLQKSCEPGWNVFKLNQCTLNRAVPEKTDILRASMGNCVMS